MVCPFGLIVIHLMEMTTVNLTGKLMSSCLQPITQINPLNPELNPICYLLALLGAHNFFHVSRIRVKSLTLRLLMSYVYIYIYTHIYIYIYTHIFIYIYIYMERLFLMFLDHTQRRTTVGRTPLDE